MNAGLRRAGGGRWLYRLATLTFILSHRGRGKNQRHVYAGLRRAGGGLRLYRLATLTFILSHQGRGKNRRHVNAALRSSGFIVWPPSPWSSPIEGEEKIKGVLPDKTLARAPALSFGHPHLSPLPSRERKKTAACCPAYRWRGRRLYRLKV